MRRGFTLVEMLVVITIIVVLASLMFPVVARSRTVAKETVCLSNLKQLYAAMQLYREDNGEYPPGSRNDRLASYMGGQKLDCFAKRNVNLLDSYTLLGLFDWPKTQPDYEKLMGEFHACRQARGGEFPVVGDKNHADLNYQLDNGARFFLLVRENGAANRIPASRGDDILTGKTKAPCGDPRWALWNF